MIVENLVSFACAMLQALFSGLQFITLPLDTLSVLLDILCYGVWVIGVDMMALILSTVTFWLGLKFSIGLVLFIWRLLPLT